MKVTPRSRPATATPRSSCWTAARHDVVLLDIVMPEMDGFEVLEAIKADPKLRDLPVIMISALED